MDNPILRIEFDESNFPEYVRVDERGIRTTYKATGYGFVKDGRVFIEYRLSDIKMEPLSERN